MKVKTIEISTSFGGVISEAPYENVKPSFRDGVTIDLLPDDDENEIRERYRSLLIEEQERAFGLLKNRLKAELIEKQYQKIKFREKGGKKYPSVTSILDWEKDWKIPEVELMQYGARGTLVHALIDKFIDTQTWFSLEMLADNGYAEEASIMTQGNLHLSVDQCSHVEFFEKFGKDFNFGKQEQVIFNDKYLYSGRFDTDGKYQDKNSIIDFKTGSVRDFRQLAAYAYGDGVKDIEQLVICPVGPTDNKTGVMKPVVETNINTQFDAFLKERTKFQQRFGI